MLPIAVPAAGRVRPAMTAAEPEFHYRFGVDLFIAGVQAMAARR